MASNTERLVATPGVQVCHKERSNLAHNHLVHGTYNNKAYCCVLFVVCSLWTA